MLVHSVWFGDFDLCSNSFSFSCVAARYFLLKLSGLAFSVAGFVFPSELACRILFSE